AKFLSRIIKQAATSTRVSVTWALPPAWRCNLAARSTHCAARCCAMQMAAPRRRSAPRSTSLAGGCDEDHRADERLAEPRGVKALIVGPPGVGKTSLLRTLDPVRTLFVDIEAGDISVQDVPVDAIRVDDWPTARDLACRIGGPNSSFPPTACYSEAHYQAVGGALVAILERVTDEFNATSWQPQMEGSRTGRELPGIVDQIITMQWIDFGDGVSTRAFVCTSPNPWGYPAKDRAGRLEQIEEPHLGKLITKLIGPGRRKPFIVSPPKQPLKI